MTDPNSSQKTAGAASTKESWGSWEIEYVTERKALIVTVTDYHAGPLEITADKLRSMLRRLEPGHELPQDPSAAPAATRPPAPSQPDTPVFTVSRKDNHLSIEIPKGWSGALKLSRKDLYRYGRELGKKGKRAGRSTPA